MISTKLIQVVSTLSQEEMEGFSAFVQNPFFNTRASSITLLGKIQKSHPHFSAEELDKRHIFEALFPAESFHEQRWKDEVKYLFRLLRQFLACTHLLKQSEAVEIHAIQELANRPTDAVFQAQWRSMERKLSNKKYRDDSTLWLLYQLYLEADKVIGKKELRIANDSLALAIKALDQLYLTQKVKGGVELLNRSRIFGTQVDLSLTSHLVEYIKQHPARFEDSVITILYQGLLSILKGEVAESHFEKWVQLLQDAIAQLPKEEVRNLFKYAQNYCTARINAGESSYLQLFFDLFRFQLDHQLIEKMSHFSYSNIIATGLRLGAFDWVYTFMEEHLPKISSDIRASVYNYNLAFYHYAQGHLQPALPLLQDIPFSDSFYARSAKVMLCKIYFETQQWDALSYLINAFQRYLSRAKELGSIHKVPYGRFLKLLKRAAKLQEIAPYLKEKELIERRDKLRKSISATQEVAHKDWLIALNI